MWELDYLSGMEEAEYKHVNTGERCGKGLGKVEGQGVTEGQGDGSGNAGGSRCWVMLICSRLQMSLDVKLSILTKSGIRL